LTRRNKISLSITLLGIAWVAGVLLVLAKADWPHWNDDGRALVRWILVPLMLLGGLERFLNRGG